MSASPYSLRSMSPHAVHAMAAAKPPRHGLRSARSRASDEDNDDVRSLNGNDNFEFAVPEVPVRKAPTRAAKPSGGSNARVATPLPAAKSPAARSAGRPAAFARLTRAATAAAAAAASAKPALVPLVAYGDDSEEEEMGQDSPREPEQPRSAPARRHESRRHEASAGDLALLQSLLLNAAKGKHAVSVEKPAPQVVVVEEEPEVEPEVERKVEKKKKDVVVVEESVQCNGTTLTGERCKRFTKEKSGFCYNHDEASIVRCMGVTQRGVRCRNHVSTDGGKHCGIHAPARVAAREAKAAEPVVRCTATTQAGEQCKRFGAGGRCFQH